MSVETRVAALEEKMTLIADFISTTVRDIARLAVDRHDLSHLQGQVDEQAEALKGLEQKCERMTQETSALAEFLTDTQTAIEDLKQGRGVQQ